MKSKILTLFALFFSINFAFAAVASNNNVITAPRVALVLGGGGARGYAELGVLTELQAAKIPVDLIVGTSIGSIVGSLYADNPDAVAVDNVLLNAKKNDFIHVALFDSLKGPFSDKTVQNFFVQHLTAQQFNQLKIKFVAVATDLTTGATVPLSQGAIAPAVNASAALPPFFHPVVINGETLIDGGASDPVAVDVAETYHPKVIIAVDISQDLPNKMPINLMGILHRFNLIRGRTLAKHSEQGASVVIQPVVGQVGVFDSAQKMMLFQAGETATQQALPQICALLAKNHIATNCGLIK